jgi:hypothetical protein
MPFSAALFDLSCLPHELALRIALQNDLHFGGKYVPCAVSASCRQISGHGDDVSLLRNN